MAQTPPLKPLHSAGTLNMLKLEELGRLETEVLMKTLRPGESHSLKARPDGTMLDGHHRIEILRARGVNVDSLPREIISGEAHNDVQPRRKPE